MDITEKRYLSVTKTRSLIQPDFLPNNFTSNLLDWYLRLS